MTVVSVGNLITTLKAANTLGEGVFWDTETQSVWWTDIEGLQIYQFQAESQQLKPFSMPYRVASFALIADDPRIIVAFDKGIALYHLETGEVEWLAQPEAHLTSNRFNDGRVDRQGRFWAGTMVENATVSLDNQPIEKRLGNLYCVDHQGCCHKKLAGINISNSLCWSPDSQYLYHTDSPEQQIIRFNFDRDSGELNAPMPLINTSDNSFPDGAEIDEQGYLWSAQWNGGKVVRYSPEGDVDLCLSLPVTNPTCVALGGKNLDWLIITTAKQGLSEQQLANEPQAGDLFIYQLNGVKGVASKRYKLQREYC